MRAVSDKRRKRDGIYATRRVEVWDRGDGVCEFCRAAEMTDVHHIAGRVGADPHRLDNLIGLCGGCHRRAHGEPEWARSVGLMRTRLGKSG
ncbi:MAG TPA: HNH endonuclease signature motif containing protein [Acidimicrobiia bacterium]